MSVQILSKIPSEAEALCFVLSLLNRLCCWKHWYTPKLRLPSTIAEIVIIVSPRIKAASLRARSASSSATLSASRLKMTWLTTFALTLPSFLHDSIALAVCTRRTLSPCDVTLTHAQDDRIKALQMTVKVFFIIRSPFMENTGSPALDNIHFCISCVFCAEIQESHDMPMSVGFKPDTVCFWEYWCRLIFPHKPVWVGQYRFFSFKRYS